MHKNLIDVDNTIAQMPLAELRDKWAAVWGIKPHPLIGRTMLEKSLAFKLCGQGLSSEHLTRLNLLIKTYNRNPKCFDKNEPQIKPGTRLVRMHGGMRHSVLVLVDGFEYKETVYRSLSQVATLIAGCRRNGWEFFGLKK
jgi:hypothetical protein